ncbi:MAG: STAS domain-containing protein [Betaproteobacteria bacterium]|nr:STAS domain-containing protein [Betaproteobacteria bacterium]
MIENTGGSLRVTAPMVIANASALLEAGRSFLQATATGGLVVDLAAVEEADSSALTVVFAWLRSARARGASLRIANPPAGMLSLAALYGVSDFLPLV